MQKLSAKLKNVPVDAPLVHCSTNPKVSREETRSAEDGLKNVKLTDNNLEVDLPV